MREWVAVLDRAVWEAQKAGHISPKASPTFLAHEIQSMAIGAHWAHQLLDDRMAYARARSTMRDRLRSVATPKSPRLP